MFPLKEALGRVRGPLRLLHIEAVAGAIMVGKCAECVQSGTRPIIARPAVTQRKKEIAAFLAVGQGLFMKDFHICFTLSPLYCHHPLQILGRYFYAS